MPDITIWLDVDLQTARKRGWGTGEIALSRKMKHFFGGFDRVLKRHTNLNPTAFFGLMALGP